MTIVIRDRRGNNRYFIDNALLRGGWGAIIGPYGIAVYNALALHANADNQAGYPSYDTIAQLTGMSRRQAIKEIEVLVSWNIISKDPRTAPDGSPTSNIYTLTAQEVWLPVTTVHQGGEPGAPPLVNLVHPPGEPGAPEQDPSYQNPINNGNANAKNAMDDFFGKKETPTLPAVKRLSSMTPTEVDEVLLLGTNSSRVLENHNWQARSESIKQGLLAFITASRLPIPYKKQDRLFWENEIQEHIFTYGLDRLPDLYKTAVEEMRDRPLREKKPEAVMTIKSPKSVSGKIADLSTRAEITGKAIRHADGGYDI